MVRMYWSRWIGTFTTGVAITNKYMFTPVTIICGYTWKWLWHPTPSVSRSRLPIPRETSRGRRIPIPRPRIGRGRWRGCSGIPRSLQTPNGGVKVFDLGNVALVRHDDFLLPLWKLPHIEGFLRVGQSREFAFQVDDFVVD